MKEGRQRRAIHKTRKAAAVRKEKARYVDGKGKERAKAARQTRAV